MQRLTGLSVWSIGEVITLGTHLMTLFAVFVLGEVHLRSARARCDRAAGAARRPGRPRRALDRLLADPGLRARMGGAGRERARRYTAGAVVPQVIDAYARALRVERR